MEARQHMEAEGTSGSAGGAQAGETLSEDEAEVKRRREYYEALMAPIKAAWGNDSEPECSICGGPRGHYGECK